MVEQPQMTEYRSIDYDKIFREGEFRTVREFAWDVISKSSKSNYKNVIKAIVKSHCTSPNILILLSIKSAMDDLKMLEELKSMHTNFLKRLKDVQRKRNSP